MNQYESWLHNRRARIHEDKSLSDNQKIHLLSKSNAEVYKEYLLSQDPKALDIVVTVKRENMEEFYDLMVEQHLNRDTISSLRIELDNPDDLYKLLGLKK